MVFEESTGDVLETAGVESGDESMGLALACI